jgi:membrane protein required for colicin V production
MSVDLVFLLLVIFALIRGFSRGLVMAVFSFIAFFIGLAAALKLSATVANYLRENTDNVPSQWWPVIAFIGVFLIVALIVRMAGKALEKTLELATLGWINKIGGFLIYLVLYLLIYSVLLFFLKEMQWISNSTLNNSVVYPYIGPWGAWVIAAIAKVLPAFKDIFSDLQEFFGEVNKRVEK